MARQPRRVLAIVKVASRAAAGARRWLSLSHPGRVEVAAIAGVYVLYEASRAVVAGDREDALRHAGDVASLERSLHLFVERDVQHGAEHVAGLVGALGAAYLTLHLAATVALLVWLHRRRPHVYPLVRTTLLFASAVALVGYLAFPTAPPRLSGLGILDTVSAHGVSLKKGLVSSLYNPYAAMPSMHAGYAAIVGATLVREARHAAVRAVGAAYPLFVVLVIVATGNHFLLDAAAGTAVAAAAAAAAFAVVRPAPARQRVAVRRAPVAAHGTLT